MSSRWRPFAGLARIVGQMLEVGNDLSGRRLESPASWVKRQIKEGRVDVLETFTQGDGGEAEQHRTEARGGSQPDDRDVDRSVGRSVPDRTLRADGSLEGWTPTPKRKSKGRLRSILRKKLADLSEEQIDDLHDQLQRQRLKVRVINFSRLAEDSPYRGAGEFDSAVFFDDGKQARILVHRKARIETLVVNKGNLDAALEALRQRSYRMLLPLAAPIGALRNNEASIYSLVSRGVDKTDVFDDVIDMDDGVEESVEGESAEGESAEGESAENAPASPEIQRTSLAIIEDRGEMEAEAESKVDQLALWSLNPYGSLSAAVAHGNTAAIIGHQEWVLKDYQEKEAELAADRVLAEFRRSNCVVLLGQDEPRRRSADASGRSGAEGFRHIDSKQATYLRRLSKGMIEPDHHKDKLPVIPEAWKSRSLFLLAHDSGLEFLGGDGSVAAVLPRREDPWSEPAGRGSVSFIELMQGLEPQSKRAVADVFMKSGSVVVRPVGKIGEESLNSLREEVKRTIGHRVSPEEITWAPGYHEAVSAFERLRSREALTKFRWSLDDKGAVKVMNRARRYDVQFYNWLSAGGDRVLSMRRQQACTLYPMFVPVMLRLTPKDHSEASRAFRVGVDEGRPIVELLEDLLEVTEGWPRGQKTRTVIKRLAGVSTQGYGMARNWEIGRARTKGINGRGLDKGPLERTADKARIYGGTEGVIANTIVQAALELPADWLPNPALKAPLSRQWAAFAQSVSGLRFLLSRLDGDVTTMVQKVGPVWQKGQIVPFSMMEEQIGLRDAEEGLSRYLFGAAFAYDLMTTKGMSKSETLNAWETAARGLGNPVRTLAAKAMRSAMKSSSLKEMEERWHVDYPRARLQIEAIRRKDEQNETAGGGSNPEFGFAQSWNGVCAPYETTVSGRTLELQPLLSVEDLEEEHRRMSHCIYSYDQAAQADSIALFRCCDKADPTVSLATIELRFSLKETGRGEEHKAADIEEETLEKWRITEDEALTGKTGRKPLCRGTFSMIQAEGKNRRPVPKDARAAIEQFVRDLNTGRHPSWPVRRVQEINRFLETLAVRTTADRVERQWGYQSQSKEALQIAYESHSHMLPVRERGLDVETWIETGGIRQAVNAVMDELKNRESAAPEPRDRTPGWRVPPGHRRGQGNDHEAGGFGRDDELLF